MSQFTVQSKVEVANLALDMVKEAPITSMDENRAAARWMNRNFDPSVHAVLTSHVWKFAKKRAKLPADAIAPEFEWRYRYRKPADCFRVLPLRLHGHINGRLIPHEVEGDYILTNAPAPLYVRYIANISNVGEWPPLFVEAVAARLAARISHFLTGKMSMAELGEARFKDVMALALSTDAAEGTHADQYATTYDDARYYYIGPENAY